MRSVILLNNNIHKVGKHHPEGKNIIRRIQLIKQNYENDTTQYRERQNDIGKKARGYKSTSVVTNQLRRANHHKHA